MSASDVLDGQRDLLERLEDRKFREVINQTTKQHNMGGNNDDAAPDALQQIVRNASAYRVTANMSLLVQHAAAMLDESDQFDRSLAPSRAGIVKFDKPLPYADVRGKTMLVHWMIWGPFKLQLESKPGVRPATMLWEFNDAYEDPDEVQGELDAAILEQYGQSGLDNARSILGRWASVGLQACWDELNIGAQLLEPGSEQAEKILSDGAFPHPGANPVRFLTAFWMLCDQTVTHSEDDHLERASRRRATKAGLTPRVRVVRLRRESSEESSDPTSEREHSHRWIVRGHWRWQAYGKGYQSRRRIWIDPFVKGPSDAPFIDSPKVYSLER